jgi:hypothetical protein
MVMSALHLKADMCGANRHVCFGPIADISGLGVIEASLTRSAYRMSRTGVTNAHLQRFTGYCTAAFLVRQVKGRASGVSRPWPQSTAGHC